MPGLPGLPGPRGPKGDPGSYELETGPDGKKIVIGEPGQPGFPVSNTSVT